MLSIKSAQKWKVMFGLNSSHHNVNWSLCVYWGRHRLVCVTRPEGNRFCHQTLVHGSQPPSLSQQRPHHHTSIIAAPLLLSPPSTVCPGGWRSGCCCGADSLSVLTGQSFSWSVAGRLWTLPLLPLLPRPADRTWRRPQKRRSWTADPSGGSGLKATRLTSLRHGSPCTWRQVGHGGSSVCVLSLQQLQGRW